jgi:hypothetical protein
LLALAAIVLVQFTAPVSAPASANLSETLYWASTTATGRRLCDRKQSARYTEQFDHRYGVRVRALMQYHVSKFGPDPDFIITTSCRILRGSIHRHDRDHARAMDRFEEALRNLEHQFGPVNNTR